MAITDRLREQATRNWKTPTSTTTSEAEDELDPTEVVREELKLYTALSFWYGFKPEYLATLPLNVLRAYVEELPRLLAETQQMMIVASSYAWMKPEQQRKIQDQLSKTQRDGKATEVDIAGLSERGRKQFFKELGIAFEEVVEPSPNGHGGGD